MDLYLREVLAGVSPFCAEVGESVLGPHPPCSMQGAPVQVQEGSEQNKHRRLLCARRAPRPWGDSMERNSQNRPVAELIFLVGTYILERKT